MTMILLKVIHGITEFTGDSVYHEIFLRCKLRNWYGNGHGGSIFSGWWLSHPSEKYEFVSWDD